MDLPDRIPSLSPLREKANGPALTLHAMKATQRHLLFFLSRPELTLRGAWHETPVLLNLKLKNEEGIEKEERVRMYIVSHDWRIDE